TVIRVVAPWARASATRNSSLRVLLPPDDRPVRSSRFSQMLGPPSAVESRFAASRGVGPGVYLRRGKRAKCIEELHRRTSEAGRPSVPDCGVNAHKPSLWSAKRRLIFGSRNIL